MAASAQTFDAHLIADERYFLIQEFLHAYHEQYLKHSMSFFLASL
jgi:hypothetical protein